MQNTIDYIVGTASDLVHKGVHINGQKVDTVGISVLAKYGIIETVGKAEKVQGKRGKVGNIYKIPVSIVKVIV